MEILIEQKKYKSNNFSDDYNNLEIAFLHSASILSGRLIELLVCLFYHGNKAPLTLLDFNWLQNLTYFHIALLSEMQRLLVSSCYKAVL